MPQRQAPLVEGAGGRVIFLRLRHLSQAKERPADAGPVAELRGRRQDLLVQTAGGLQVAFAHRPIRERG